MDRFIQVDSEVQSSIQVNSVKEVQEMLPRIQLMFIVFDTRQ